MSDSVGSEYVGATRHQIETMVLIHKCELRQIDALLPTLLQPEIVAMYSRRRQMLLDAITDLERTLREMPHADA
ncbi:MAG: hypothetical protein PHR28_13910 [candidate division Zixibacteria bacterium]|jgi:hypothetical protein|nr:hypothetical protein [candidate division Zixibacteria bacterium]